MDPRKQKLEAIFHAALELAAPEQRDIYLNRACEGDAALRAQVEALLRAVENADKFFESNLGSGPLEKAPTGPN